MLFGSSGILWAQRSAEDASMGTPIGWIGISANSLVFSTSIGRGSRPHSRLLALVDSGKTRAKAKKQSKATRGKAVAKRAVARAKPKRAPVKKAARPVAPAVETVTVEVIEQPVPAVTATEVEETEIRQAS